MSRTKRILGGILVTLLVVILIGPFFVPVPPLEDTVSRRALAGEASRFREISGIEVHYQEAGSGQPALILLHGFGASTFSWREVIDPLSEWGRVVAYDRPAFGLTERPLRWEGANPYSPQAQVELVLELMDELGIQEGVLVGNSAGGTIALSTALQHPERVSALVLVDPAVYSGGGAPALVKPVLSTPQMDRLGPLLARRISSAGDDFLERSWHDPSRITPEVLAGYRKPLRTPGWDQALWELTKASQAPDLAGRLDELKVPTLVITGDDDQVVPTAQSIQLAVDIPGAVLSVAQDCGHLPQEECPTQFLGALRMFLMDQGMVAP